MKAITVVPGRPEQARVDDVGEPSPAEGSVLVEGRLLGLCGTDYEIVEMQGYGWPPPGQERLVIGHESLGSVLEAPEGSGFAPGDLVCGIVRRPDPVPCEPCANGEWDFCRNGRYTERGIKERHGFGSQRWRIEPEFAVRLDLELGDCGVLVEPASVIAKAWEQTERIFARASWRPKVALVTGAGPIGLLAALFGVQRGLEVHVLDVNDVGAKVGLVRDLGATFHVGDVADLGVMPDVVIECTGYGPLVFQLASVVAPNGVLCLTGLSSGTRRVPISVDQLNKEMVLENTVLFGTVNAARRHYEQAAAALARADRDWLARMITKRLPMEAFREGLRKGADDVKVVVDLRA
ncbi:glucose 1-dehydrogenase [Thermasporomyces composti]|jgi:threonine dehydrogenase-like Zn-dependent dehydrogenase|uniref:Threonine dehydrogenase-like Zn-dependent dehydrogenase n=1 Tax=Thermasporomyces composti TaxID=696763 RepID=A0A3D9V588_THECX|nr:glucose 1-dehydrogenase [Thermasporomyces composti]PZN17828.1 MAG: theronine dehydrogenase [Chloroflexota bacterium]REF35863.1 threonine dehydrogenase-like Zn-dependent dehydrogenase [Thermasporomyces composti]